MSAPVLGAGVEGAEKKVAVDRHEPQVTEGLMVYQEGQIWRHLGEV